MTMKTTLFVGLGTTALLILLAITAFFVSRHFSSNKETAASYTPFKAVKFGSQEKEMEAEVSQTPLMRALSHSNDAEAQRLIEQGDVGDVNAVDSRGDSTLMYALSYATSERMQQLLDYSIRTKQLIDVNYVNQQEGRSALLLAFQYATSEHMQQLLDYSIQTGQHIDVNYVFEEDGLSALEYAILMGKMEQIQQLFDYAIQIGQSIDVNKVNQQNGESTLMNAIEGPTSELVQQLLDYSVRTDQSIDVNYVNQQTGVSTFLYALRNARNTEVLNTIRLLIHHPSFDVNRRLNERGETALMLAMSVEGGRADVVKELLELPDIDLHQRNIDGKTIEQYALGSNNDEIKRLFGVAELGRDSLVGEVLGQRSFGPSGL